MGIENKEKNITIKASKCGLEKFNKAIKAELSFKDHENEYLNKPNDEENKPSKWLDKQEFDFEKKFNSMDERVRYYKAREKFDDISDEAFEEAYSNFKDLRNNATFGIMNENINMKFYIDQEENKEKEKVVKRNTKPKVKPKNKK